MDAFKEKVFGIILRKYVFGYLVQGWKALEGHKTWLSILGLILVPFAEQHGIVSKELAAQINTGLVTSAGFSFMSKLDRYKGLIQIAANTAAEAATEASKPADGGSKQ